MGVWLRKGRLQRGHTLKDVSQAIGKSIQYVSEVEHGKRGHKMDPVTAMQWCEYLHLDTDTIFVFLGLGDTELERFRVRHYLETSAWASKYTRAQRGLKDALREQRDLVGRLRHGTFEKDLAKQVLERIEAAVTCLHIPQTSKDS